MNFSGRMGGRRRCELCFAASHSQRECARVAPTTPYSRTPVCFSFLFSLSLSLSLFFFFFFPLPFFTHESAPVLVPGVNPLPYWLSPLWVARPLGLLSSLAVVSLLLLLVSNHVGGNPILGECPELWGSRTGAP